MANRDEIIAVIEALNSFPELSGKTVSCRKSPGGIECVVVDLDGTQNYFGLSTYNVRDPHSPEFLNEIIQKVRHGSFLGAVTNYQKLEAELAEVQASAENKQNIIDGLEREVLKLETQIENWRELYNEERSRCDEYRWADDSRNGRLQDGR